MTPAAEDQAALAAWIWGLAPDVPAGLLPVQGQGQQALERGLGAYREHAKALAVRALSQAYPLLCQWLGPSDFAGLAWAYARQHPPEQGDMNRWGLSLPQFLLSLDGMDDEPPALAALEAHLHALAWAADPTPPDASLWQDLQAQAPEAISLRLQEGLALFTLPESLEPLWPPEEAEGGRVRVAWRQGWQPRSVALSVAAAQFLQACLERASLAQAIEAGLKAEPALDLGRLLAQAWQQGWLREVIDVEDAPEA